MFPIRMTHKHHGAQHVYDHNSLEVAKKAGWEIESAPAKSTAPAPKAVKADAEPKAA